MHLKRTVITHVPCDRNKHFRSLCAQTCLGEKKLFISLFRICVCFANMLIKGHFVERKVEGTQPSSRVSASSDCTTDRQRTLLDAHFHSVCLVVRLQRRMCSLLEVHSLPCWQGHVRVMRRGKLSKFPIKSSRMTEIWEGKTAELLTHMWTCAASGARGRSPGMPPPRQQKPELWNSSACSPRKR